MSSCSQEFIATVSAPADAIVIGFRRGSTVAVRPCALTPYSCLLCRKPIEASTAWPVQSLWRALQSLRSAEMTGHRLAQLLRDHAGDSAP